MTQFQKAMLVRDSLKKLGVPIINIAESMDDRRVEQSYQLLVENPKISKKKFLDKMGLEEETD